MNWVFSFLTTAAIIVIAFYAYSNYKLTVQLRDSAKHHQQELSDLYQAIVIATLLTSNTGTDVNLLITTFNHYYKGATKIF
jgi:hypothetical protein